MFQVARRTAFATAAVLLWVGIAARGEGPPRPLRGTYLHPDRIIPRGASSDQQLTAIRGALDRMRQAGFNAIFPYFTGSSGQAFYASTIHSEKFYGAADPLAVLVQEARGRGLQVYPVLCVTVCGNDKPAGILREHADWALRNPDGSPLGYISPCHPDARQWLAAVAREIVEEYQPDGVLLDYIRYHNRPLRLDGDAEARFQANLAPNTTPDQEQKLMQQFKEDGLTELVRLYRTTVDAARPGTRLGIYSWGPHVAANHQIAQCWPRWVKENYLDFVNVSGYYHHDKYGDKYLALFEEKMRAALALNLATGRPVPLSFALGVVTSHGKVHSAEDIRAYLHQAAEVGFDGVIVFTWDTLGPFLNDLDTAGDIRRFPAGDGNQSPSPTGPR